MRCGRDSLIPMARLGIRVTQPCQVRQGLEEAAVWSKPCTPLLRVEDEYLDDSCLRIWPASRSWCGSPLAVEAGCPLSWSGRAGEEYGPAKLEYLTQEKIDRSHDAPGLVRLLRLAP